MAMLNLYVLPYWFFVMWLDVVTYLHHHGPSDPEEEVPWYRNEVRACRAQAVPHARRGGAGRGSGTSSSSSSGGRAAA